MSRLRGTVWRRLVGCRIEIFHRPILRLTSVFLLHQPFAGLSWRPEAPSFAGAALPLVSPEAKASCPLLPPRSGIGPGAWVASLSCRVACEIRQISPPLSMTELTALGELPSIRGRTKGAQLKRGTTRACAHVIPLVMTWSVALRGPMAFRPKPDNEARPLSRTGRPSCAATYAPPNIMSSPRTLN